MFALQYTEHAVGLALAAAQLQRHAAAQLNSGDGYLTPVALTLRRPNTPPASQRSSWAPSVVRAAAWDGHTPRSSRHTSMLSLFSERSRQPQLCYADLAFSALELTGRSRGPNDPLPARPVESEKERTTTLSRSNVGRSVVCLVGRELQRRGAG